MPIEPSIPTLFVLNQDGGFVARGTFGTGNIPASGLGARMMWHPAKAAFRAGEATIPVWDDGNVGVYSTVFGFNSLASGPFSVAMGGANQALGPGSTALGNNTVASAGFSTAFGSNTVASGLASTTLGAGTKAIGDYSIAAGSNSSATAAASFAMGNGTIASGAGSVAFGTVSQANGVNSVAMGVRVEPEGTSVSSLARTPLRKRRRPAHSFLPTTPRLLTSSALRRTNFSCARPVAWGSTPMLR